MPLRRSRQRPLPGRSAGFLQPRGGTARHDAVAWGYARAPPTARRRHHRALRGHRHPPRGRRVTGVETTRGSIARRQGVPGRRRHILAARRHGGPDAADREPRAAGVRAEGIKPCSTASSPTARGHFYVSQSDKGGLVFGGDIDGYNTYAQRGKLPMVERCRRRGRDADAGARAPASAAPWGGVMDMTMDGSPIIGRTPLDGLYLNGGWCYGGFKAIPGRLVLRATDRHGRAAPAHAAITSTASAPGVSRRARRRPVPLHCT